MQLSTSDRVLLDRLRERVEYEYRTGLAAIDQLESLLLQDEDQGSSEAAKFTSVLSFISASQSKRERVLTCITDCWASVNEIEQSTGLDPKDIRGVLYARVVEEYVQKDRVGGNGELRFRISGDDFRDRFHKGKKVPQAG